jgi:hypothetical protein
MPSVALTTTAVFVIVLCPPMIIVADTSPLNYLQRQNRYPIPASIAGPKSRYSFGFNRESHR